MSQERMYTEIINLLSGMTVGRTKPVALTADESLVLARLTGAWMKKLQIQPSGARPDVFDDAVTEFQLWWDYGTHLQHVHENADSWSVMALGAWQGTSVRLGIKRPSGC